MEAVYFMVPLPSESKNTHQGNIVPIFVRGWNCLNPRGRAMPWMQLVFYQIFSPVLVLFFSFLWSMLNFAKRRLQGCSKKSNNNWLINWLIIRQRRHLPSGTTDENSPSLDLSSWGWIGLTREAGRIWGRSDSAGTLCRYTVLFSLSACSNAAPSVLLRALKDSFSSGDADLRSFFADSRILWASCTDIIFSDKGSTHWVSWPGPHWHRCSH